jgi:hypothetical protein
MKIDGGCHCGYITYEAEADPEKTTICHCTDCQRLSGSAFSNRRPRPRRHIQNHRRADHLCKDRRKRCKTSARILPPMWNTNLFNRRRRRGEILLHPCGDCTPTRRACPEGADLVALTTPLGHRPRLRSQRREAVGYGALIRTRRISS